MTSEPMPELGDLAGADRLGQLEAIAERVNDSGSLALSNGSRDQVVAHMVDVIQAGLGDSRQRMIIGQALGLLGDPRLSSSDSADYWASLPHEDGPVVIGRHLVTNAEYSAWVDAGGYDDDNNWDEDGLAWRTSANTPWHVRSNGKGSAPFVVPNQPVVGVSWHEASAFARSHGARLPRFDERLWAVRGPEKRPYPWGSPFGVGNANTREEVLGRPCAVGLFVRDRTPDGVCDLAGNAGEWCADGVGDEAWVHPGSWEQPSMAAWAKARVLEPRSSAAASRGFRLVRV